MFISLFCCLMSQSTKVVMVRPTLFAIFCMHYSMPKPLFKFLIITAIFFWGVQKFQIFGLNNNYSQEDKIHTAYIHKIMWRI